jgi:hypothetical protein
MPSLLYAHSHSHRQFLSISTLTSTYVRKRALRSLESESIINFEFALRLIVDRTLSAPKFNAALLHPLEHIRDEVEPISELFLVKFMLVKVALKDLPFFRAGQVLQFLYQDADIAVIFVDILQ